MGKHQELNAKVDSHQVGVRGFTVDVMPESPEREILAKFFADMGEKCGEKMAKFFAGFKSFNFQEKWAQENFRQHGQKMRRKNGEFFADFRPSISRKSGRKKFHRKLATTSAGREIKFFHRETLEFGGFTVHVILRFF